MKQFKCDPVTGSEMGAVADKLAWAGIAEAAITVGGERRVICKRDPNAGAADPWTTGTVFRNVGSYGALKTAGGTITGLGLLYGTTVQLAADMMTGASVLRIARPDGTRWIQGSLGPSAAMQRAAGVSEGSEQEYDFTVDWNFTSTNGLGITSNFVISGPRYLASGVGTPPPAKTDDMPHIMELENWTNPASPTLAGSCTLDRRIDNWVYDDPEMAAEVGDAAVYQSSTLASLAEFDFAPTLIISDAHNNHSSTSARWEVLVGMAVSRTRTTWTTYPGEDTFNPQVHTTFPPAFKIRFKNKLGATVKVIEMHDGRPVNPHRAKQGDFNPNMAMEPNINVGNLLPAWSDGPKKSSRANKWVPGLNANSMRISRSHSQVTSIAVEPLLTGGYGGNSKNGMHNMWAMLKWPCKQQHQNPLPRDPWGSVDNEFNRSGASSEFGAYMTGWGYDPGAFGGHNWYTGPGGPRFDRGPIPSVLALWVTNPDFVRPQESVPIREMAWAWALNYCNHSNHWMTDPRTLSLAKNNQELMTEWDLKGYYYGDYGQRGPKVIDTKGQMRDGENASHFDKNGQFFWNGWNRDGLHSYASACHAALLMNSPMLAMVGKWDSFWQLKRGGGIGRSDYMVRAQAWLWLHYMLAWKTGSKHPLGLAQQQVEDILQGHLENLHDEIYVKVYIQNENSPFANGLRKLGQPVIPDGGGQTQGGGLGMYMANVLAMWKQTGLWSRMKNKNEKCKRVLEMQMQHIDKYVFDVTLRSKMSKWPTMAIPNINDIKDWATYDPPVGMEDLTRNDDGSMRTGDRDVSMHPFTCWVYVRKYYFPEYPHPDLEAAFQKTEAMLNAVGTYVAAVTDPQQQKGRDHPYGYPGISPWKAPAEGLLGPA